MQKYISTRQMTVVSKSLPQQGVVRYVVSREREASNLNGKYVKDSWISLKIDHDADVFTSDGKLLLRFRKNVLSNENVQSAYDSMIGFARNTTGARGATSGSKVKDVRTNKRIASNILGYFDQWTLLQKHMFKSLERKPKYPVRVTRFTADFSSQWEMVIPLIREIDQLYKRLVPSCYKVQLEKAKETAFRIGDTTFSTVTINLNLVTAIHKDQGNLQGSFGNLVVISKGEYTGGYTCFPEYGVGVDVRSGDFLAMDVHQYHGNTPIQKKTKDAERLSMVCYMRHNLWERTRGTTKKDVHTCLYDLKNITSEYYRQKKHDR
jgi:Oxygenase domain of the 2OGFeDO superfamily